MATQRHKVGVDRISGLPQQPILQQILSLLSQEEAVRTCVLSKSWRHHWCTRPNVEFREESFKGKEQTFESFIDKTLQRYYDQNLSIHEFRLQVSNYYYPESVAELLRKWIRKLKIFNIYLLPEEMSSSFEPSPVFEAESLQKLYLEGCTLDKKCVVNVLCKHLKTLHLERVDIEDDTLKNIISRCPLIESVTFKHCPWLRATTKVDDKLHNLKHFEVKTKSGCCMPRREIDVQSAVIERIKISGYDIRFRNDQYHRNLKSLSLKEVRLSSELFDLFSCNYMPSLKFLKLKDCIGFKELHLSSRSIKHLSLDFLRLSYKEYNIRATIDAPNILCFEYKSYRLPSVFSFATTSSREWKSKVWLRCYSSLCDHLELHELLMELSGSEISLKLSNRLPYKGEKTGYTHFHDKKPVVVDYLKLWLRNHSIASRSAFLNELFGLCRPRILVNARSTEDIENEFLEMDTGDLYQQDLEEVSMETFVVTDGRYYHDCFQLKWREI